MMDITLLGIPFNSDGTLPEVENPSQGLRDAGLVQLLKERCGKVHDAGDLSIPKADGYRDEETRILNYRAWQDITKKTSAKVTKFLNKRTFPILLGGDCGILFGIFHAYHAAQRPIGLLYLDAHADFRTPETSPSGETAELILTLLTGRGPQPIYRWAERSPLLPDERIYVFGFREYDRIEDSTVLRADRRLVRSTGLEGSVLKTLNHFATLKIPVWVHFDVDILDPSLMPVVFPESDGLTFEEMESLLREVFSSGLAAGMDITCFHPKMDPEGQAARKLVHVVSSALSAYPGMT